MRSLLRGEPDAVFRASRWLLGGGLLLVFVSVQFDAPGVFTAFFAGGLGAAGGTFVRWRTEHGLWMLAALFLVMFGGTYVLVAVGQLRELMAGPRAFNGVAFLDTTLGTLFLVALVKFLMIVAIENWRLSRG